MKMEWFKIIKATFKAIYNTLNIYVYMGIYAQVYVYTFTHIHISIYLHAWSANVQYEWVIRQTLITAKAKHTYASAVTIWVIFEFENKLMHINWTVLS